MFPVPIIPAVPLPVTQPIPQTQCRHRAGHTAQTVFLTHRAPTIPMLYIKTFQTPQAKHTDQISFLMAIFLPILRLLRLIPGTGWTAAGLGREVR